MTSKTRRSFWICFDALPNTTQQIARQRFLLWRHNSAHPSLHFKELHKGLWSVRISDSYRAVGLRDGNLIVWFWIGTHAEYDRLVQRK